MLTTLSIPSFAKILRSVKTILRVERIFKVTQFYHASLIKAIANFYAL